MNPQEDKEITISRKPRSASHNLRYWIPMFLIWPFAALITAFKNYRSEGAKTIVWLYMVFFGMVFYIPDLLTSGKDTVSYVNWFHGMRNTNISFGTLLSNFYSGNARGVDIYQPLVTWLVASFTGNPHVLFTVYAAVMGWFTVQNLWMVYLRMSPQAVKKNFPLILFMILFAIAVPIWNINGVRMWTAAQVLGYGVFSYYLCDEKKKGIFWIVMSVFFHFSFFFPIVIFLCFLFVPKKLTPLILLFLLSAFFSELNIESARSKLLHYLPDFLHNRVLSYTSESVLEKISRTHIDYSIHQVVAKAFMRWLVYVWVYLLYRYRKAWVDAMPRVKVLFAFALFFGIFANITSSIPSVGRFQSVVKLLMYGIFILVISKTLKIKTIRICLGLCMPFILFSVIFKFWAGSQYFGVLPFVANPFIGFFVADGNTIYHYVKEFFHIF